MIVIDLDKKTIYRIRALRDMTVRTGYSGVKEVMENDIFEGQYELTLDDCLCFWINDPDQGFGEDFADAVYFPIDGIEVRELIGV